MKKQLFNQLFPMTCLYSMKKTFISNDLPVLSEQTVICKDLPVLSELTVIYNDLPVLYEETVI